MAGPAYKKDALKDPKFWGSLTVIIVGAAFFGFLFFGPKSPPPELDAYGCVEGNDRAAYLIVIDASDPYSEFQQERVRAAWKSLLGSLKEQDFVTVALATPGDAQILFKSCVPDNGRWSILRGLRQSDVDPTAIRALFRENFQRPIEAAIDGETLNTSQRSSPIIGSINDGMADAGDKWTMAEARHLIVISDMIEVDRPTFSLLSRNGRGVDFDRIERADGYPWIESLSGASEGKTDVKIYFVLREKYRAQQRDARGTRGPRLRTFWEDIFKAADASAVRFIELPEERRR